MLLQHLEREETPPSYRIGLSGPPGVGKSTFIEAFGSWLLHRDPALRLGVLAVDPSSTRTGGALLGDKTRMPGLSAHERAYVRPSPSRGTLGGVAARTGEAIRLLEGAGYPLVLVETVGVGQSEVAVASLVDCLLLLVAPGGGDELQGLKRGVMEHVDLVLVTKADGALAQPALQAQFEYAHALKLLPPRHAVWRPRVLRASAVTQAGFPELWEALSTYRHTLQGSGHWAQQRRTQRTQRFWTLLDEALRSRLLAQPALQQALPQLLEQLQQGALTAPAAVDEILRKL